MKSFYLSLALVWLPVSLLSAQTNEQIVKLTGIISLPGVKVALLELQNSRGGQVSRRKLGEGQRDQGVNVLGIDAKTETVDVSCDGHVKTLKFSGDETEREIDSGIAVVHPTVHLQRADLQQVLDLLDELTERNVLRPSAFKPMPISLRVAARSNSEAAETLAGVLRQQGIATIFEGEKFAIVAPNDLTNVMTQLSEEVRSNISHDLSPSTNSETIAPGLIKFRRAPAEQVLAIYAAYTGRRLANRSDLTKQTMWAGVTFRNVTPLSRSEACYALEMLLACNGIRIVRNEDGSFNAVPSVGSTTKP